VAEAFLSDALIIWFHLAAGAGDLLAYYLVRCSNHPAKMAAVSNVVGVPAFSSVPAV
jgi:hypothetical protein